MCVIDRDVYSHALAHGETLQEEADDEENNGEKKNVRWHRLVTFADVELCREGTCVAHARDLAYRSERSHEWYPAQIGEDCVERGRRRDVQRLTYHGSFIDEYVEDVDRL